MCHYCGADQAKLKDEKQKLENGDSLKLNGEEPIWSCQFCQEKLEPESMNHDGLSHSMSPMTSPTTSLSISDRSISSCSKFLPLLVTHLIYLCDILISCCIILMFFFFWLFVCLGDLSVDVNLHDRYVSHL